MNYKTQTLIEPEAPATRAQSKTAAPGSDTAFSNDEPRGNKWELFVLLSFIVLSFAGLFFCCYVILAKCRGTWPF